MHVAYRLLQSAEDSSVLKGASCAFGVFDGLHKGHQFLLNQAVATAQETSGKVVALTFDKDPDELFAPHSLRKLMSNDARLHALQNVEGVSLVAAFPATAEFFSLEPEQFLATAFAQGVPGHIHVGSDFRFGAHAAGSVEMLTEWGNQKGCCVHAHTLISAQGDPITATRVRALLGDGAIDQANDLLGHPYTLEGRVVSGRGEGSHFGFATANLQIDEQLRVLGDGVYAAWAKVGDDRYRAAVSVGIAPTFADTATAHIEAHLLDFEGNLVGSCLALEFVAFLRSMRTFASTDELIATVTENIEQVRRLLR